MNYESFVEGYNFNRLEALTKHIKYVQKSTQILAEKLHEDQEDTLALELVRLGYIHDNSKFYGIEWEYLHEDSKVNAPDKFNMAYFHHVKTNPHHPNYWGGVDKMPKIYILEMCCDWYARSLEFDNDIKEWFDNEGAKSIHLSKESNSILYKYVHKYVYFFSNYLYNRKFGLLTPIKRTKDKNNKPQWICLCECGKETVAYQPDLKRGNKKSCGCATHVTGSSSFNWRGFGAISGAKWGGMKKSAEKRDISFNISIEYAWRLFEEQMERCALTGVKLSFPKTSNEKSLASLDRINPKIGYEEGNVQWVHPILNYMKYTLQQDEFLDWCSKVIEYNKKED